VQLEVASDAGSNGCQEIGRRHVTGGAPDRAHYLFEWLGGKQPNPALHEQRACGRSPRISGGRTLATSVQRTTLTVTRARRWQR
jgi:hypothetical protein